MLIGLALIAAAVAVISKWPESPVSEPGNDGRSAGVVESPPSIEIPWDDGVDQSLQELSSEVELLFEQSSHQAPP